jgi:hypothetical protein
MDTTARIIRFPKNKSPKAKQMGRKLKELIKAGYGEPRKAEKPLQSRSLNIMFSGWQILKPEGMRDRGWLITFTKLAETNTEFAAVWNKPGYSDFFTAYINETPYPPSNRQEVSSPIEDQKIEAAKPPQKFIEPELTRQGQPTASKPSPQSPPPERNLGRWQIELDELFGRIKAKKSYVAEDLARRVNQLYDKATNLASSLEILSERMNGMKRSFGSPKDWLARIEHGEIAPSPLLYYRPGEIACDPELGDPTTFANAFREVWRTSSQTLIDAARALFRTTGENAFLPPFTSVAARPPIQSRPPQTPTINEALPSPQKAPVIAEKAKPQIIPKPVPKPQKSATPHEAAKEKEPIVPKSLTSQTAPKRKTLKKAPPPAAPKAASSAPLIIPRKVKTDGRPVQGELYAIKLGQAFETLYRLSKLQPGAFAALIGPNVGTRSLFAGRDIPCPFELKTHDTIQKLEDASLAIESPEWDLIQEYATGIKNPNVPTSDELNIVGKKKEKTVPRSQPDEAHYYSSAKYPPKAKLLLLSVLKGLKYIDGLSEEQIAEEFGEKLSFIKAAMIGNKPLSPAFFWEHGWFTALKERPLFKTTYERSQTLLNAFEKYANEQQAVQDRKARHVPKPSIEPEEETPSPAPEPKSTYEDRGFYDGLSYTSNSPLSETVKRIFPPLPASVDETAELVVVWKKTAADFVRNLRLDGAEIETFGSENEQSMETTRRVENESPSVPLMDYAKTVIQMCATAGMDPENPPGTRQGQALLKLKAAYREITSQIGPALVKKLTHNHGALGIAASQ